MVSCLPYLVVVALNESLVVLGHRITVQYQEGFKSRSDSSRDLIAAKGPGLIHLGVKAEGVRPPTLKVSR